MRTRSGYTPTEFVLDSILEHLRIFVLTVERDNEDERPSVIKQIRIQAAKKHNRLLENSTLDGVALEEK